VHDPLALLERFLVLLCHRCRARRIERDVYLVEREVLVAGLFSAQGGQRQHPALAAQPLQVAATRALLVQSGRVCGWLGLHDLGGARSEEITLSDDLVAADEARLDVSLCRASAGADSPRRRRQSRNSLRLTPARIMWSR
jgi:hypothetical protein